MIDKLEIRVPAQTPLSPDLQPILNILRNGGSVTGFAPSAHYAKVGDLRPFGIEAILHLQCKHGPEHNHKLELLNTGTAGASELLDRTERVFRFAPEKAGVMRVDLTADVRDVAVSAFENAAYVAYKRSAWDIGKLECSRAGGREVETIYLGKRPNCIRIYNKREEFHNQYRALVRRLGRAACALPFERIFGIPETAILTRVERQIGGGRVPLELGTVNALFSNAPEFNPFANLRLCFGAAKLPRPESVGLSIWLQGMYLRELILSQGMQRARRFLNQHSNGNTARMLEQLGPFLPNADSTEITAEQLYEIYRDSVKKQLSA